MRGNGSTKFGASHPSRDCAPLAIGLKGESANSSAKVAGAMVTVECMHCDKPFTRYACHVYRRERYFCGRACTDSAKVIRIATQCCICHRPMEQTPSDAERVTTCSKECSSKRRSVESPKNPYHAPLYRAAVLAARKIETCSDCGRRHGPWMVRDALTLPRLQCQSCYGHETCDARWAKPEA